MLASSLYVLFPIPLAAVAYHIPLPPIKTREVFFFRIYFSLYFWMGRWSRQERMEREQEAARGGIRLGLLWWSGELNQHLKLLHICFLIFFIYFI